MTTAELDAIAEDAIRTAGATPSFLGYQGFPASICASVNDEVVHGIPGDRELREGDLVSLDCGAIVDGWHGDAAITVPVGEVAPELVALVADTEAAMWAGIAAARPGGRVGDISAAVEARLRGPTGSYGILEDYTGHGIGTAMHQPPDVPNVGRAGRGARLVQGIALAVEPMVTLGGHETDAARRRLDRGDRRRLVGRARRAHLRAHRPRRLGAHRPGRRRGGADRARGPVRGAGTLAGSPAYARCGG